MNSIAPGAINTKFLDEVLEAGPEKAGQAMYERALQQREAGGQSPEKAADLTAYLMGDEAEFITGRLLSAIWDPWQTFDKNIGGLEDEKLYTLRRLVPQEV